MNENEKRLFAEVAAENEEYVRMLKATKRSTGFLSIVWIAFAVVLGIATKDIYTPFLAVMLAILMLGGFWRVNLLQKKKLIIYADRVCYNKNGQKDESLEMKPEEYSIELKLKMTRAGYSIYFIFRDRSEDKKKLLEYVSDSLRLPADEKIFAPWQVDLERLETEIIDPQGILKRYGDNV